MRTSIRNVFESHVYSFLWILVQRILWSSAQQPPITPVQVTQVLWALGPCQSAFWIPSSNSEFNSNWITYLFEGNPISQTGDCLFTLESDPNTRIELVIQEVNLFGSTAIQPPPCLTLYDVKEDGSVIMLKKECQAMLMDNSLESQPTFTETNLAVVSSTIRYGSFQLRARAVPKTYGIPPRVSSTTTTFTTPTTIVTTPFSTTSTGSNITYTPFAPTWNATTTTFPTTTFPTTTFTPTSTTQTPTTPPKTRLLSDILYPYELNNRKNGQDDV